MILSLRPLEVREQTHSLSRAELRRLRSQFSGKLIGVSGNLSPVVRFMLAMCRCCVGGSCAETSASFAAVTDMNVVDQMTASTVS